VKFTLNNYRCFAQTPAIEVKPLTFIVGENSAGKTSLMAALRFGLELSRSPDASFFNKYPFDLGPYEDIVYDGDISSASKRFSVKIEKFVKLSNAQMFPAGERKGKDLPILVECTFFFRSNFGETALSSVRLESEGDQMDVRFDNSVTVVMLSNGGRTEITQDEMFFLSQGKSVSLQGSFYSFAMLRFRKDEQNLSADDRDRLDRFSTLYDAFLSDNYEIVATPPVRSVPRKVYTSQDDSSSDRAASAPHELSRIKRSDRARWTKINRELNRLGRNSGLFNKFDVKKLTDQDSGPFQLKVTVRGRASAISDVGYGVSQSLPIFTDIISHRGLKSALLMQQPEVHLHPKAQAELGTIFSEFVDKNSKGIIIAETHSDHLIDRVRIEIVEGRLSPLLVNVVFLEPTSSGVDVHQISFDNQGNIKGAPPSYRDFFIREQERVLGF
jgi:AAA ATPase domain